jgi:hypothetical protein
MELVTPAFWPTKISTFSGVKLQAARSERPEQEMVTKAGPVNVETHVCKGTMVIVPVPD